MKTKEGSEQSPGKISSIARWLVFVVGGLFFLIIVVAAVYRKIGG